MTASGAAAPGLSLEQSLSMDQFQSPADLWSRCQTGKNLAPAHAEIVLQDSFEEVIAERIEYLHEDGKLVTESLRDYSR